MKLYTFTALTDISSDQINDEMLDTIIDDLEQYHAVTSAHPISGDLEIIFTRQEPNLAMAIEDGPNILEPVLNKFDARLIELTLDDA